MQDRALFLSDVHLNPEDPRRQRGFIEFLRSSAHDVPVYLLGDLFDYWIGPRHLGRSDYRIVVEGLRDLAQGGRRLHFLPGNRDYLVDARFEAATGIRLLQAETEIRLAGRRVALTHGDFLYNRNPKYGAYRRLMTFRIVRAGYLALPASLGTGIARGFRKISVRTTPSTLWSKRDLLAGADRHFRRGIDVVVCGHIHQPCHLRRDGKELFVLGDWRAGGEYAEFDGQEFSLRRV